MSVCFEPAAPDDAGPPTVLGAPPESDQALKPRRAPESDGAVESLAGSFLLMLLMMVVQRALGLSREILFCRWLDAEALGEWELALAFMSLAAPLAVLGIPGSFGRYVEHFRQAGQLAGYLRRSLLAVAVLSLAAVAAMLAMPGVVAEQVFGRVQQSGLVLPLALALAGVIGFNLAGDLFSGLRRFRAVSMLQCVQALAFAGLGLGLTVVWESSARAIIVAYGGACLLAILVAGALWRGARRDAFRAPSPEASHGAAGHKPATLASILRRVGPFAAWLWLTNLLLNLFLIVDRYLLLHHSGLPYDQALVLVGNYRASRVVPLLLATVASTLVGVALPHGSHDWEAGRRDDVARRFRLMLKLYALAGMAAAVVALVAKPLLFDIAFRGKFAGGEAVLPGTFMYCLWIGMGLVAHYYLLCAERASRGSLAVAAGLLANIGLNLILAPRYGLVGVVTATALANLLVLLFACLVAARDGLRLDAGMWIVMALPATLLAGPWTAAAALALVCAWAMFSGRGGRPALFDAQERGDLQQFWDGVRSKLRRTRPGAPADDPRCLSPAP